MTKQPKSEATKVFGERVRHRRLERGMTQESLAEKCGMHWSFIGQVERGQTNISLHNLLRIAEGLDIDPGQLVRELRTS
jgi:transcriptional regulator with XRE-family HTH domain